MVASFGTGCAMDEIPSEKLDLRWRAGKLCGWLFRPKHVAHPPAVIVMGGFDEWREEYNLRAVQLVERGIAVLLSDGPGQGETRLVHNPYLDPGFPDAFATAAVHLR